MMNPINQEKLLAQAESLCQQRNVRLTPQRLEVLRLMAQQPGAISAYDLLDLLRVAEPQAKPPTVYRALDFYWSKGLFTVLNQPIAMFSATTLKNPRILLPCLSVIAARL